MKKSVTVHGLKFMLLLSSRKIQDAIAVILSKRAMQREKVFAARSLAQACLKRFDQVASDEDRGEVGVLAEEAADPAGALGEDAIVPQQQALDEAVLPKRLRDARRAIRAQALLAQIQASVG